MQNKGQEATGRLESLMSNELGEKKVTDIFIDLQSFIISLIQYVQYAATEKKKNIQVLTHAINLFLKVAVDFY